MSDNKPLITNREGKMAALQVVGWEERESNAILDEERIIRKEIIDFGRC